MKKKILLILFLLLLFIPAVYALFQPGFFQSDDGEWMVIRFSAFYQALADGQFPVRFLGRLNHGYGYPVANFLYPGFMYLATPLQILGVGFVNSIKAIMIASMLGGGVFAFSWLSKLFDKRSALVGSIFFVYTPYHLFDLYKRGSVGELLSLMFVTFILFMIEEKNKFLITIGVFLLALSHNSLFLLFLPLLFVYALLRNKLNFKDLLIFFGLGILMSSFFTIPAIFELSYTNFSKIEISDISQHFATIELIGISSILVLAGSLFVLYLKKIRQSREIYLFVFVSFISILLSISLSSIFWTFLPASLIQFPFRVLSFLIISSAFLSGYIANSFQGGRKRIIFVLLLGLIFISSLNYLFPKIRFDKEEGLYSTNEATTTVKDEYMPIWVKEKPTKHFDKKVEIDGVDVSNLAYNSKKIYFETSLLADTSAKINTIYYPGWQAKVNGIKTEILFNNPKGVIEINLPKGENRVELGFFETPLRLVSDLISAIAFLILIFLNRKILLKNILVRRIK